MTKLRKGGNMKTLIVVVVMVLMAGVVCSEEPEPSSDFTTTLTIFSPTTSNHTLAFTDDGEILLDGQPVEKLSHPEIKAILKEIAEALKKQVENDSVLKQHDRQTGYLLEELEKCLNSK